MFEKKISDTDKRRQGTMNKAKKQLLGSKGIGVLKAVVLPLLLAGVVTCLIFLSMQSKAKELSLKSPVLVAKENIYANTIIEEGKAEEYFESRMVEASAVPDSAITSFSELPSSFYVTESLEKNQMVLGSKVEKDSVLLKKYRYGYEVTSFNVKKFYGGINGSLRRGDIIDIYAIDPLTDMLTLMVEDVYVRDVYDNSGEMIGEDGEPAVSFTVYVTKDEVEKMNQAICFGDIQIYMKNR